MAANFSIEIQPLKNYINNREIFGFSKLSLILLLMVCITYYRFSIKLA